MQIGVLKSESTPMVAMVPSVVSKYIKDGYTISIETGAGAASFYADELYKEAGAQVVSRSEVLSISDLLLVDGDLADAELEALESRCDSYW